MIDTKQFLLIEVLVKSNYRSTDHIRIANAIVASLQTSYDPKLIEVEKRSQTSDENEKVSVKIILQMNKPE